MLLQLSACTVDLDRRLVLRDGREHRLSRTELALLRWLAGRPGRVSSREELLTEVWGYAPGVQSRAPENTISRLRRKIERDPKEPDHLIQVYGVGYRFEYHRPERASPPAATGSADLSGRTELLAALHRAAAQGRRLLVLTGPGGIGKTWLARRYAEEWTGGAPPAGSAFVTLSQARTAEQATQRLAEALRIPLRPTCGRGELARLRGAALRGSTLLVLDGLDQLAGLAAPLVERWLAEAPALTVLATSHRPLDHPEALCLEVPPLDAEGSLHLFTERSRRAIWGAAPEASEPLRELLTGSLGGLPLAIELVAARAGTLGVLRLVESLGERARLQRSPRGETPQQAALALSLGWSWDLLDDVERAALAWCSPFRGGFSFEAAEAILEGPGAPLHGRRDTSTLDVLQSLRDCALIQALDAGPGEPRLALLEAVQVRAAEQLRQHYSTLRASRPHAAWYARACERAAASGEAGERLARERENLCAALQRTLEDRRADAGDRASVAARLALGLAAVYERWGPPSGWPALLEQCLMLEGLGDRQRRALLHSLDRARRQLEPPRRDSGTR